MSLGLGTASSEKNRLLDVLLAVTAHSSVWKTLSVESPVSYFLAKLKRE